MSDEQLSEDLIARLRARAADPQQRTDTAVLDARSVDLGALLGSMPGFEAGLPPELKSAFGPLSGLMGGIKVMTMPVGPGAALHQPAPSPAPAAEPSAPCSETAIAEAEAALGFPLPPGLRQLYAEIGDGGFGPGGGVFGLAELVAKYREMTDEPAGPRGQAWPPALLPIQGEQWDLVCLDRDSGTLTYFDAEELAEGESDAHWRRAFKDEAESLEAWLAAWLERPAGPPPIGFPGDVKAG